MIEQFKKEVDTGLSATTKYISSKYLYDDLGSEIFQSIMSMPAYYLTDAEFEILSLQSKEIYANLEFKTKFNIIELGAGDGVKTIQLLKNFLEIRKDFSYIPIDISQKAIDSLTLNVQKGLPELKIDPKVGDYFSILQKLPKDSQNLILFLGSNIGNYQAKDAKYLLKTIQKIMKPNDKLLIGFDLQKNPITIKNAYDDSHGITKSFNLNLLRRINTELEADFRLDKFDFYCHYNPLTGELMSYLVSLKKQEVYIKSLNKRYFFDTNELICTELSKKYSFFEIENLSKTTGFKLIHHFLDCKHYFTDSLWTK